MSTTSHPIQRGRSLFRERRQTRSVDNLRPIQNLEPLVEIEPPTSPTYDSRITPFPRRIVSKKRNSLRKRRTEPNIRKEILLQEAMRAFHRAGRILPDDGDVLPSYDHNSGSLDSTVSSPSGLDCSDDSSTQQEAGSSDDETDSDCSSSDDDEDWLSTREPLPTPNISIQDAPPDPITNADMASSIEVLHFEYTPEDELSHQCEGGYDSLVESEEVVEMDVFLIELLDAQIAVYDLDIVIAREDGDLEAEEKAKEDQRHLKSVLRDMSRGNR